MDAAFALRLLVSVLLTSRSTCALLGGCTRRATALDHRRGVQLTAVEMESSDTTQIGSLPAFGDVPQDLAADQIVPDEWNPDSVVADGPGSFVEIFRSSTPYIKMHRASTMVIHIDTRVLDEERLLADLMDDVALITVLGVLPVLVISIRDQVDTRLREMDVEPRFHGGLRISDPVVIRVLQEVSGFARSRVEAALSRGRGSRGAGGVSVGVVGGNLFYTAQPLGVRDGIDLGSTGEVRRVEVDKIRAHLNSGEIVLLGALGYSASGDVFNVKSEEVASRAAAALGASKLIFLSYSRLMTRTTFPGNVTANFALASQQPAWLGEASSDGEVGLRQVQSMRLGDAKRLVQDRAEALELAEESCNVELDSMASCTVASVLALCGHCVGALEQGVTRAHLVPPVGGALLKELYTLDGIGTLLSRDLYDGIRRAVPEDTPGIIELIQPLEKQGVLIKRPRAALAREVHAGFFYVFTRDSTILGCAMLRRYSQTSAELGCLVVSPQYRRQGTGDALLGFLERTAVAAGVAQLFVLSTNTMQWFLERDFDEVQLSDLPPERQKLYNPQRNSKIYSKVLESSRRIDAEELFWSAGLGLP